MFRRPRHLHLKGEFNLGIAGQSRNRRSIAVMRRGRQRDMAFARQQARGRVKPDPASTRQVNLTPGVQIGKIIGRSGRPVNRRQIGLQLDQIARDKPCRKTQMPQRLHQQPTGVTARPQTNAQRLLRRLNPRFHADHVADLARHARIQPDDEVDGS